MSEEPTSRERPDKPAEADDPMELIGVSLPGGDDELMATCLIEEFAQLGMGEEEIFELFRQPIYQIHALYRERGDAWVRNRIRSVLVRTPPLRVSIKVSEPIGGSDA